MAPTTAAVFVVGAVATLLVVYVSVVWLKRQKSYNLPPGPKPLPIIGSLHLLGAHPHWSLADLARKYGPVISLQLGQRPYVVATSPEAAKEFLKLQDANFSSRPVLRCAELILPGDVAFHDVTSPEIRHLRKILVSELMSVKRLEASKYIRTEEIAYMLGAIAKESATLAPVSVKTHLSVMTNNVLTRMVLSKRFLGAEYIGGTVFYGGAANDSEIREFLEIVAEQTICFGSIHLQDFFNLPKWFDPQGLNLRFRRLRARMDAFYTNLTNQHKQNRRNNPVSDEWEKNLLDVLLDQLDSPEHTITNDHVQGLIWDALSAGTETTVVTSEWAMAEVLHSSAVMRQARAELDRVVSRERTVQESDIPELHYIRAIVKETLRLHPPLPLLIPHLNTAPTQAFGYTIPAKVRVFVNVWAIGRDSQIWQKPLEFRPERFLNEVSTAEFQGQHFELTPFGAGRRMCPGMAFGSTSVHLQVANLLHAFEWSFPGGVGGESLDMAEAPPGLTLRKRDPLVAIAKPRLPAHLY